MTQEQWNQYSFNFQMVNIGAEIERTFSIWKKKLQSKEDVWPYNFQCVKCAQELIEFSKNDPKNIGLIREFENAEDELNYFLSMGGYYEPEEWDEEAKRLLDYWNNYTQAHVAEADISSTRYYFLVRGHRDWNHDDDQWIGIYNNKKRAKEAYEVSVAALKQDCEMDSWLYEGEEILIYVFDEERDMFFQNISPKDFGVEEEE